MLIPHFWATGKFISRVNNKPVTIQRWGWSDASQLAAQAHADTRARGAFDQMSQGNPPKRFARRERKVSYNGAEGVPIREEILQVRGLDVLTRNSYGAVCLNTPDVLFVDVDTEELQSRARRPVNLVIALTLLICGAWGMYVLKTCACTASDPSPWPRLLILYAGVGVGLAALRYIILRPYAKGAVAFSSMVLNAMAKKDTSVHWRVYETPGGARLLAIHDVFSAKSPTTQMLMENLLADRLYARMCFRQDCFRARVSPKPWRVPGLSRLRGPVWPVPEDRLPARAKWVEGYEAACQGFASCRLAEVIGKSFNQHPRAVQVKEWHDALCQATSKKPLA